MVKKISKIIFIVAIVLITINPLFVSAKNKRVIDETGQLSQQQIDELNLLCDQLSEKHQADICIVVVNSTDGEDIDDYANRIYEEYGYGIGDNYSGILLTVDMDNRIYYQTTDLDGICFNYITDYSIENLGQVFVDNYSSYDLYTALKQWILKVDEILNSAEQGNVIDVVTEDVIFCLKDESGKLLDGTFYIYDSNDNFYDVLNCYNGYGKINIEQGKQYKAVCDNIDGRYEVTKDIYFNTDSSQINIVAKKSSPNYGLAAAIGAGVGLISALIYTGILRSKNKSVRKKYDAITYLREGSFRLFPDSRDVYLYSHTTRTAKPKRDDNNDSFGGHSSGGSSFSGSIGGHSGGRSGGSF